MSDRDLPGDLGYVPPLVMSPGSPVVSVTLTKADIDGVLVASGLPEEAVRGMWFRFLERMMGRAREG